MCNLLLYQNIHRLVGFFYLISQFLKIIVAVNVILFARVMFQLQKLPTRPDGMFMHLRHMTCRIIVHSRPQEANYDIEVLQMAYCLDAAPQLETLQLNVSVVLFIKKY